MTKYKITGRRYDINGNPITVPHSTIIDTQWAEYKGATSYGEITEAFERKFNVPQKDGSKIRVDNIERLNDKAEEENKK